MKTQINLRKQFGSRSWPTECGSWSVSKSFDATKDSLEKKSADDNKSMRNYPASKREIKSDLTGSNDLTWSDVIQWS